MVLARKWWVEPWPSSIVFLEQDVGIGHLITEVIGHPREALLHFLGNE